MAVIFLGVALAAVTAGCGGGSPQPDVDGGADAATDAAVAPLPNGSVCTLGSGCESGFCVDGMCCDVACEGLCESCAAVTTGGVDGTCAPANDGTVCREPAGTCDTPEVCMAGACPADALLPAATVCRSSGGDCDTEEQCDGVSAVCPDDSLVADGTVCRAAGGDCDIEERCDGLNATCPSDALVAQGTTCREAAGLCDLEEACTGADTACPSDEQAVAGVTCRPSAGGCDIAEVCSGGVNDCPSDTLVSNGQVGECAPYVCSGVAACPTSCTLSTECAVGHGCSDGVCVPAKRIFVTSTTYTGNLGGAAGADALCQGRADSVSLGGTWRAWISTITSSAATRLTHFAGPYVQVNRTKIADSWADLTDGSLDLGITVSESGQAFAVQSTRYWTGSSTSGNATLATCMGFTNATSGFNGDTGLVGFTTSAWTSSGADGCSASWRLVCIEQ